MNKPPFNSWYPLPPQQPPAPEVVRSLLAGGIFSYYQPAPQPEPPSISKLFDMLPPITTGELHSESLDSLYTFFCECRGIIRKFPVGKIASEGEEHLGVLISRIFSV